MKFFSLGLLCLTLLGCGSSRTTLKVRDPFFQLQKNIQSILSDSLFIPCQASMKIVSLMDGKILFEKDSRKLLHPASNMKLLTSAAALSLLDTNFQFRTSVFLDSEPKDGTVLGNIYLKGNGNPDLTTADLDSLAVTIHRQGIFRITGELVLDNSYFDDQYWGPGWTWDDDPDPDAPYINALSVNKNCIRISLLSDTSNVYSYIDPITDFVTILNDATVAKDSITHPISVRRQSDGKINTITITGEMGPYSQFSQKITIRDPEYYCGTLFKDALQRNGVFVLGNISRGIISPWAQNIASHEYPIRQMIIDMNKVSDNLSAENCLKILSAQHYGVPGSTSSGISLLKRYLSSIGLDTTNISLADGSGVSRYNLLTTDYLVQFLRAVYQQPKIFPIFYQSLPIAGSDGTLANRMTFHAGSSNIHAKTGTLNGVSCLSGYAQTRDGELLAFSFFMQNFVASTSHYRFAQDRICTLLTEFSRNRTHTAKR